MLINQLKDAMSINQTRAIKWLAVASMPTYKAVHLRKQHYICHKTLSDFYSLY